MRRVLANAEPLQSYAHVHRLPCSEVLQRRSPKDSFEKSRIGNLTTGRHKDICREECDTSARITAPGYIRRENRAVIPAPG